jgi:putative ATP-dependent endonuclease of the OLD family
MHIRSLEIQNFRSIEKLSLKFDAGINVLIGKNNSGKSAVIDALRLCLTDRRPEAKKDIFFNPMKDFYVNLQATPPTQTKEAKFRVALEAKLSKSEQQQVSEIENEDEKEEKARELKLNSQASYYHLAHLNADRNGIEFSYTLRYFMEVDYKGEERLRSEIWTGSNNQKKVPTAVWDAFYAIYLQPLRDAVSALQPPYSKLGEHFDYIGGSETEKKTHAENIHKKMKEEPGWQGLISTATTNIRDGHLKSMTLSSMPSNMQIGFLPAEYRRIANLLRVRFPYLEEADNFETDFFDTDQNGLGYNNLVFASTVLANLNKRKEAELDSSSFLLIEEPEAHLHPQSQSQFFSYLNTLSNDNCQIFVTSHSPTLTAKTDLEKIIVLNSVNKKIVATHLTDLDLSKDDKVFLKKFMDVTKSQLYFAESIIFAEGYSEALCMPEFGNLMGVDFNKEGVELVNIQGVAFARFTKLFQGDESLQSGFAVITDKDATKDNGSARIAKLTADLASQSDHLFVSDGENFEDSLYAVEGNRPVLDDVWRSIRPAKNVETEITAFHADPALFEKDVDRLNLKTELAFTLAEHLAKGGITFTVPTYLQNAVNKALNKGNESQH